MKSCPSCGAAIDSHLATCPYCGAAADAAPPGGGFGAPGTPPAAGFGPPQGDYGRGAGAPPYGGPGNPYMPPQASLGMDEGPAPNTGLALGLAIAVTLCCCLPGGIYSIVLANQAGASVKMGDFLGAKEKLKTAYIVMGICAVLGAIANAAYIALQFSNEF